MQSSFRVYFGKFNALPFHMKVHGHTPHALSRHSSTINVAGTVATAPFTVFRNQVPEDWGEIRLPIDTKTAAGIEMARALHILVRKGIPGDRRKEVWPYLTGADALLRKRPRLVQHAFSNTFPLSMEACNGNIAEVCCTEACP